MINSGLDDFRPAQARPESFEIVTRMVADPPGSDVEVVEFVVGGRSFIELVAAAERAEGASDELAGGYVGVPRREFDWRRHLLADDPDPWNSGRGTRLLGCACFEAGCWPFYGRISVDDAWVYWHHFANGHRNWTYAELGPFRFDRVAYEQSVAALDR